MTAMQPNTTPDARRRPWLVPAALIITAIAFAAGGYAVGAMGTQPTTADITAVTSTSTTAAPATSAAQAGLDAAAVLVRLVAAGLPITNTAATIAGHACLSLVLRRCQFPYRTN